MKREGVSSQVPLVTTLANQTVDRTSLIYLVDMGNTLYIRLLW